MSPQSLPAPLFPPSTTTRQEACEGAVTNLQPPCLRRPFYGFIFLLILASLAFWSVLVTLQGQPASFSLGDLPSSCSPAPKGKKEKNSHPSRPRAHPNLLLSKAKLEHPPRLREIPVVPPQRRDRQPYLDCRLRVGPIRVAPSSPRRVGHAIHGPRAFVHLTLSIHLCLARLSHPRPSPTCLSDSVVVASARTTRVVIPSAAVDLGQTPTTRPPVRSFNLFSRNDIRVFSSCSCARPQASPASADTMSPITSLRIIQHPCVWGASADNQHRGRSLWWRHHRFLWQHWGYDTSLSFERCERCVSLVDVFLGGLTALLWNAPDAFSKCLAPLPSLFQ